MQNNNVNKYINNNDDNLLNNFTTDYYKLLNYVVNLYTCNNKFAIYDGNISFMKLYLSYFKYVPKIIYKNLKVLVEIKKKNIKHSNNNNHISLYHIFGYVCFCLPTNNGILSLKQLCDNCYGGIQNYKTYVCYEDYFYPKRVNIYTYTYSYCHHNVIKFNRILRLHANEYCGIKNLLTRLYDFKLVIYYMKILAYNDIINLILTFVDDEFDYSII